MHNPPSGTVTFLFTDIEGSTRRWEANPQQMASALSRHDNLLRRDIEAEGGYVFKTVGDAFCAAFPTAAQAVQAAVGIQRALQSESWEGGADIHVRMALHSGATEERGGDYFGQTVNRVARLLSAGHGGQVLISAATWELVRDHLPSSVTLRDMGEHRLKDLARPEHVFQIVAEGLPSEFPPLITLDNRTNNLPPQPNPLVGREREVAAVKSSLRKEDVRLLTLTGAGGIGKTRLALQVGAELLDDYPDGVFFINLAPIVDPSLVVPTTAYTLGLREAGGQSIEEILREYLKNRHLLLVLDNFEQVVEAAPGAAGLLKSARRVKMLVTSRSALGLSMEHQYTVPTLAVPDPRQLPSLEALFQYDAVKLFVQRAEAVKPGFEVNEGNARAVAEICYRLEGIPLAIELAAARVKVLTPQSLVERLGSRLKLLTGGARDLPSRHQTLRNTIEWSYDLLSEEEQKLFRRLAVFWGGRTLEAVDEVCNAEGDLELDPLDGISSLVDKSLMYVLEGSGGEPRYWMLETIQEYAWEKLQASGEAGKLQSQHAVYFMRLAEEAEPQMAGKGQQRWLDRLQDDYNNIRAALEWAIGQSKVATGLNATSEAVQARKAREAGEVGLRTAGAIYRFWLVRGLYTEGREHLQSLLSMSSISEIPHVMGEEHSSNALSMPARAKALNAAGGLAWRQGDYSAARTLTQAALELGREVGDKVSMSLSLNNLGGLAQEQGDYEGARILYEESLALKRELGDKQGVAASLNNLGSVAYAQGDYGRARTLHGESLALKRELGDKRGVAASFNNLGNVAYAQGDYAAAGSLYEESLALHRELGDKWGVAASLGNLGNVALMKGDYTAVRAVHEESLALRRGLGDKWGISHSLSNLADVAYAQRDYARACALHEESLALRRELGGKDGISSSLNRLGLVACMRGEYLRARALYEESLALKCEIGDKKGTAECLAGLGGVAIGMAIGAGQAGQVDEEVERGARLLGAVEGLLKSIGAVLDDLDRPPYESSVQRARALLGEEAFERAWQEGRAMSMEQAIEYALAGTPLSRNG